MSIQATINQTLALASLGSGRLKESAKEDYETQKLIYKAMTGEEYNRPITDKQASRGGLAGYKKAQKMVESAEENEMSKKRLQNQRNRIAAEQDAIRKEAESFEASQAETKQIAQMSPEEIEEMQKAEAYRDVPTSPRAKAKQSLENAKETRRNSMFMEFPLKDVGLTDIRRLKK